MFYILNNIYCVTIFELIIIQYKRNERNVARISKQASKQTKEKLKLQIHPKLSGLQTIGLTQRYKEQILSTQFIFNLSIAKKKPHQQNACIIYFECKIHLACNENGIRDRNKRKSIKLGGVI